MRLEKIEDSSDLIHRDPAMKRMEEEEGRRRRKRKKIRECRWLFKCCSNVPLKIALKFDNWIFRLLNWKTIAPRPRYEFLTNAMFKDNGKVQSKADSHVEKVAVSKRESHVKKEIFISKKVFDAFREEVRQEFKGDREEFTRIRQLVKKRFKKMVKASVETSPQQFSPTVDQNLDENQDDAANLTAGGQVTHLNEYINRFRMHAAVPWHTVEDIYIPVNIKKKYHWVLAILSFLERSIFLYDSYELSGHYPPVLDVIEKLAAIIPLCLQQCDFYVKKGIDVENNPTYKDKNSSDMFDVLF
ncbi:hypothetical protein FXO38_09690 [Capsicum annuum]|nr:hypothetical protein FXO37_11821 [Capsicum annuum]KAF3665253.1 hypothetical protein FXO38_09690 [Capsicum annuum]